MGKPTPVKKILEEKNIILATKDPAVRGGFTQVPNFILRNLKLSPNAKLTYALLLSYAWHNDFCFPGQKRLAKDLGVSLVSTNRYIKELERQGFVSIKRRGLGRTNIYTLHFRVKKKHKGQI